MLWWRLRLWYLRLVGVIPKEEPRYVSTIWNGKLIVFDEPLTMWQSVAAIAAEERKHSLSAEAGGQD